jgi:hypothetical protein
MRSSSLSCCAVVTLGAILTTHCPPAAEMLVFTDSIARVNASMPAALSRHCVSST